MAPSVSTDPAPCEIQTVCGPISLDNTLTLPKVANAAFAAQ